MPPECILRTTQGGAIDFGSAFHNFVRCVDGFVVVLGTLLKQTLANYFSRRNLLEINMFLTTSANTRQDQTRQPAKVNIHLRNAEPQCHAAWRLQSFGRNINTPVSNWAHSFHTQN